MNHPLSQTAREAARAIREGRLSPVELIDACLERIAAQDARLHAWVCLRVDKARQEAERAERMAREGVSLGPLHGVPVGVKDIFDVAGMPTAAGSPILEGRIAGADADVVARLRQAGAVILGKTVTTQFACYDPAPTRNPHHLEHTPGGSSSGSAAAVAAFHCFGALGSQTGGSILRPAAFCGIAGLKPTHGALSLRGVVPVAESLDHPGPLARSAADVALFWEALGGEAGLAAETTGARMERLAGGRIGVPDRYFPERASPDTVKAFEASLAVLERLGMAVQPVRLPGLFEAGADAGGLIMRAEAANVHFDWFRERRADYLPKLEALLEAGLRIPAASYLRAQKVRLAARQQMAALFGEIDFLATPATTGPAPHGLGSTGDPVFNAPFSTFGLPALAVPVGRAENGLPLGLQLVAAHGAESALLRLGIAFEEAADLEAMIPPEFGL